MNAWREVIERYDGAVRTADFAKFEKDLARQVEAALVAGYREAYTETPLVESVTSAVNGLSSAGNHSEFSIRTRAAFIHGSRSQVRFDFEGEPAQRELGDLIFIVVLVFHGQKLFEKLTITQFKKEKHKKTRALWDIGNREQLYLLSRFPTFTGVSGSLLSGRAYHFRNISACLGSYGFLYGPGDFAFLSAVRLDAFLGRARSLDFSGLYEAAHMAGGCQYSCCRILSFSHAKPLGCFLLGPCPEPCHTAAVGGNAHSAHNVYEFVSRYLAFQIGEPVVAGTQLSVFSKDLLRGAMTSAAAIGDRERQSIQMLAEEYLKYGSTGDEGQRRSEGDVQTDFDGEGLGVILTTIDLGNSDGNSK